MDECSLAPFGERKGCGRWKEFKNNGFQKKMIKNKITQN